MGHLHPDQVHQILAGNAAKLYNFDLEALRPAADQFGPTVAEVANPLKELPEGANQALLRSAKHDSPLPGSRRRAMVALGVGGSLLASSTASAASLAGIGLLKWLGIVALASAVVGGSVLGVQAVNAPQAAPARRGAAQATQAVEAVVVERAAATAASVAAAPESIALDSLPAAPGEPAGAAAGTPRPAAPSLADEVAALDNVSQVMGSDPQAALAQLEKHDKQFAGGALGPEAMVLRIEALARSGDKARATALANEFFAKHGDSPLRGRVQSILAKLRSDAPSDSAAPAGATPSTRP